MVNINGVQNLSLANQKTHRTWFGKMFFQQHRISYKLQLITSFFIAGGKFKFNGIGCVISFNHHVNNTVKAKVVILYF